MILGREFQREGAEMEKALSPHVRCSVLWGMERRHQRSGADGMECDGEADRSGSRGPGYGGLCKWALKDRKRVTVHPAVGVSLRQLSSAWQESALQTGSGLKAPKGEQHLCVLPTVPSGADYIMLLNLTQCWIVIGTAQRTISTHAIITLALLDPTMLNVVYVFFMSRVWVEQLHYVFTVTALTYWISVALIKSSQATICIDNLAISLLIFQSHIAVLWRTKWEREVSVRVQPLRLWDQGHGEFCFDPLHII